MSVGEGGQDVSVGSVRDGNWRGGSDGRFTEINETRWEPCKSQSHSRLSLTDCTTSSEVRGARKLPACRHMRIVCPVPLCPHRSASWRMPRRWTA